MSAPRYRRGPQRLLLVRWWFHLPPIVQWVINFALLILVIAAVVKIANALGVS